MGIENTETTVYKTQSNGQGERLNRTVCLGNALQDMIAKASPPKIALPLLKPTKNSPH